MRCAAAIFLPCVLLLSLLFPQTGLGADPKIEPKLNNGRKWRIGYYEGGPWRDYRESLRVTVQGLMDLGWIERQPLPAVSESDREPTRPMWEWLASTTRSRTIEFVAEAFWTSEWKDELREKNREDCIRRLQEGHVDLMFAMGTWAGKDLANNRHAVPTMVMSTTDPIRAGIILGAEDSGFDHVHARCDPGRYRRQIQLFQDIFGFRRIGAILNVGMAEGRTLAHLDDLEAVGIERGFEVIVCEITDDGSSMQESISQYRACVERLAPKVGAFYLADHRGTEPDLLWETIQPLLRHKVPVWSARGAVLVEHGALMSVAKESFDFLAPFYARVVARIFHGEKPRNIPQVVREKIRLAVNLETAALIGYTIPPNVLKVSDIVYDRIQKPQPKP
ncbi:MAG: ABC transporter substrate binding protein [Thermodesulfobacteriota bacterium]